MDKSITELVSEQRRDTKNTDANSISTNDFVRYNQYAQNRLYSLITKEYSWVFETTIEKTILANTDIYLVGDNLAFNTRIVWVEYSPTGNDKDYRPLMPVNTRYERLIRSSRPQQYRRIDGGIQIEPKPTTAQGSLRITYERALDKLDIQRRKVTGLSTGSGSYTLTTGGDLDSSNTSALVANVYICASDFSGTPVLYNGVVLSTTTTDVVVSGDIYDHLLEGYDIVDILNTYITVGKYSTTHSKLSNECEGYLTEYVSRYINNVDSGESVVDRFLKETEGLLVESYKNTDKDRKFIPIHDQNILIPGYE